MHSFCLHLFSFFNALFFLTHQACLVYFLLGNVFWKITFSKNQPLQTDNLSKNKIQYLDSQNLHRQMEMSDGRPGVSCSSKFHVTHGQLQLISAANPSPTEQYRPQVLLSAGLTTVLLLKYTFSLATLSI
jgi:hypothetical protein